MVPVIQVSNRQTVVPLEVCVVLDVILVLIVPQVLPQATRQGVMGAPQRQILVAKGLQVVEQRLGLSIVCSMP